MKAREFKSVRQAAIASGIIRPPDQHEICWKHYPELSSQEREVSLFRIREQSNR
jgi:hypothetical protein